MKFGIRKPNLKKSFKARTTGKLKRSVKKAVIPGYGKKGMGWIKNPKKAAYNKIYNKTSFSVLPSISVTSKSKKKGKNSSNHSEIHTTVHLDQQRTNYNQGRNLKTMKVCKYCGTENVDSASSCSNCGANEFKNKCPNCGTIYEDGNFCPKCGVKAGSKAKECPNCGTEYYSMACPNCGYTNRNSNSTDMYTGTSVQTVNKRKTWLWVLGWILIFPVPLTILIIRNEKLNKWTRIGIIATAWIFYILIAFTGNLSADNTPQTETASILETISDESNDILTEINETSSSDLIVYAEDEVINRFISEFNENSDMKITDIEKGNIRTKYFGYANGRYLEIVNANNAAAEAFYITINGGQNEAEKNSMFEVFKKILKILDSSVTDDMIDNAISEFNEKDILLDDYKIGKNLSVKYIPAKEMSYGKDSCRIDISAFNYK